MGKEKNYSHTFIFLFEIKLELMCTTHQCCFSGILAWTVGGECVYSGMGQREQQCHLVMDVGFE